MSRPAAPRLSILVLTEDSGGDALDTVCAVVGKMLGLVQNGCRTHLIEFKPADERSKAAVRGNFWKAGDEHHNTKVYLGRVMAAKLLERDECPGFVLFHFDGDRAWQDRATSENVAKFADFVAHFVAPSVETALRRQRDGAPVDEAEIAREKAVAIAHLRSLTPFYSIEAWLYQNTATARELCCGKAEHLELIEAWERDRDQLDEIWKPKRTDHFCLGAAHNLELARAGYPAEEVFLRGTKSYSAAVVSLTDCEDLCAALERTLS